jgi:spoIIIJ-associated protein
MEDPEAKKKKVADFLQTLTSPGRLNLKFNILACNGQVHPGTPADVSAGAELEPNASDSAGAAPKPSTPEICVELSGPDVPLLLSRNGELLLAIEHIAAKILRFEHEEHDRISFDAENFKVLRHQELVLAAQAAIERVRRTGQPFSFSPMSSRERRLLHLALAPSGLATASSGEGPRRFVVLYPEGEKPPADPSPTDRAQAIRHRFRRR